MEVYLKKMARVVKRAFSSKEIDQLRKSGQLKVEIISGTAILRVTEYTRVWQTYFNRKKTKRIGQRVGLKVGSFLVPHRQIVTKKELDFWQKSKKSLEDLGIFQQEDGRYYKYIFNRPADLDRAHRQQGYILKFYGRSDFESTDKLLETLSDPQKEIVKRVENRRQTTKYLIEETFAAIELWRENIQSILDYAPLWTAEYANIEDIVKLANTLRRYSKMFFKIRFKPVEKNLRFARQSLLCAVNNLEADRFKYAKKNLASAIKNLEYPKEEKPCSTI